MHSRVDSTSETSVFRATIIAKQLRAAFPSAQRIACRLTEESGSQFVVFDAQGERCEEAIEEFELLFDHCQFDEFSDRPVPLVAESPSLAGFHAFVECLQFRKRHLGEIAIAFDNVADENGRAIRTELLTFAADLSAQIYFQNADVQGKNATPAYLLGLAKPLAHECNNFLNVICLQLALLERDLADSDRFQEIRRQSDMLKTVVHKFQSYQYAKDDFIATLPLNSLIRDVIGSLVRHPPRYPELNLYFATHANRDEPGVKITLNLSPSELQIISSAADLEQLLTFLVFGSAEGMGAGSLLFETSKQGEHIHLKLTEDRVGEHYSQPCRWGENSLEWAAVTAIVRKLDGNIERTDNSSASFTTEITIPCLSTPYGL